MQEPKILLYDIETAPIVAHVWGLWENNVGLNQIVSDSHMLSWSAKWLDSKKVMYMDQRNAPVIENDKKLVQGLAVLLNQADIVVTHNGKNFDEKIVNTRLAIHGLKPLLPNQHIDTLPLAKRKFRMTSNKLEYIAKILKVPYQKLTKREFQGHDLWTQCLKGNVKAWNEMKRYNATDTLVLEEVYKRLRPWDTTFNPTVYTDNPNNRCDCGSHEFINNGYRITRTARYQRIVCKNCGKSYKGKTNLLKADRRKSMLNV